jgi:hypothetical protein
VNLHGDLGGAGDHVTGPDQGLPVVHLDRAGFGRRPSSAFTLAVTVVGERTPGSRGAIVAVVVVAFGGAGIVKPTSVGSWSLERYAFGA